MTQITGPVHVEHVHMREWRPYVIFMVCLARFPTTARADWVLGATHGTR